MPSAHVLTGFVEISSSRSPPLICFSLTLWSIKTRLRSDCFSLYANVSNPSVSKFRLALVQSGLAWAGSLGFKRWDLARPSCQLPIESAGDGGLFSMAQQAVGLLAVVTNPGSSCLELPLGVPEENKLENRKCCCCSTDLFILKRLFCQNLVAEWYFSPTPLSDQLWTVLVSLFKCKLLSVTPNY